MKKAKDAGPDTDWQRIWLSARKREWNSVAIVPSHTGIDVAEVAERLTETGRVHGERSVKLINAIGVQLAAVNELIESIEAAAAHGELVVVPVDPISENPSTMAIVRAMSASLLVVRLGESQIAAAQSVIDTIGRDRLLGSVVLDPVKSGRRAAKRVAETAEKSTVG